MRRADRRWLLAAALGCAGVVAIAMVAQMLPRTFGPGRCSGSAQVLGLETHKVQEDPEAVLEFWTDERMREAEAPDITEPPGDTDC